MNLRNIDPAKRLDVVSVGSWTNFDHLFRVDRLPAPGDTVRITSPIADIETVYWGGCAPNNVAAAAKLGAKAGLITVVGEDFAARGYHDYLSSLGVDLNGLIMIEGEHSGHSFLYADPHGDAICLSHVGVSNRQDDYEPNVAVLSAAKVVIINYQFDQFTYKAAQAAHEAGCLVITSGNLATSTHYVEEILRNTDLLICTEHELGILLHQLGQTGHSSWLYQIGVQAILETHGVDGCIIRPPSDHSKIPAILSKNMVDPVGAGDGFAGGVATGLAFGWKLEDAARLGAVVASFIVEAVGCQTNQPSFELATKRLKDNGVLIPTSRINS
jgi:sugar/nucleoside kinase (ribokinase family)